MYGDSADGNEESFNGLAGSMGGTVAFATLLRAIARADQRPPSKAAGRAVGKPRL